uniref:Uncharacterized protein n=1 Tax=Arundo donax TaxID=35708 RepID=A0A0A9G8J3_ARUDO
MMMHHQLIVTAMQPKKGIRLSHKKYGMVDQFVLVSIYLM